MIPRSSWGASATSPRAEGEEREVRNKDRAGAPRAKVSVVISRRASVMREFKRGIVAAGPFYHYRPFSHYPPFASFAFLFSLTIFASFATQNPNTTVCFEISDETAPCVSIARALSEED